MKAAILCLQINLCVKILADSLQVLEDNDTRTDFTAVLFITMLPLV